MSRKVKNKEKKSHSNCYYPKSLFVDFRTRIRYHRYSKMSVVYPFGKVVKKGKHLRHIVINGRSRFDADYDKKETYNRRKY